MAADLGPSADLAPLFVHLASASTIDLSRLEPVLYLLASHKPRPSSEEVKEAAKKAYVAAQESAAQARMEKEAIDGKLAAAEPEARKTLEEVNHFTCSPRVIRRSLTSTFVSIYSPRKNGNEPN